MQWLEVAGYAVEYCDNHDLSDPSNYGDFLDKYNIFLSVGHDEYVAGEEKDNLLLFRKSSNPLNPSVLLRHARNLSFLSGNTFYWRVIYANGGRQIHCNKDGGNLDTVAVYNYRSSYSTWERGKLTALNRCLGNFIGAPLTVKPGMASHWIFGNTGLSTGEIFGRGTGYPGGIGGYEIDYRSPDSNRTDEYPDSVRYGNIKVLADTAYEAQEATKCPPAPCTTTVYVRCEAAYHEYPDSSGSSKSRSKTFSAGCINWSWGLADTSDKTAKITKNITDGLAATLRGHVTQSMTWSGSIYLGGDVTVDTGVTLTLSPGTRILVFPNNDVERTGMDTTKTELIVKGRLIAVGDQTTASDSIIFTSASTSPAAGDWGGILVSNNGKASFDFCRVSYANVAISSRGDSVRVRDCTFDHFKGFAFYATTTKLDLGKVTFLPCCCGLNSILMKTSLSTGAKAVDYGGTGTLYAQGNWWDSTPPPSSWFIGSVNTNYYLHGTASPDSCGNGLKPPPKVIANLPTEFGLGQNYPNPFNPNTSIKYALPKAAHVVLEVFNILGQKVRTLVDEEQGVGYYQVLWDGTDQRGRAVSTGTYLYRFRAGDYIETKKMQLVK